METIIYLALIGTIVVAIVSFALDLLDIRTKTHTVSEVGHNAFLMQERLSEAARHAEGVNTGNSTFDTDPGVLELDMIEANRDPVVFQLTQDDGTLEMTEGGNASINISSDDIAVTNLTFRNLTSTEDVGIIQVEFTLTATDLNGNPLYQYEETYQTTLRIPFDN